MSSRTGRESAALLVALFLTGCGGGGSSSGTGPAPAYDNLFVAWKQPPLYSDNVTFLDIRRDIRLYEIVMYDNASQLAAWEGRAFPDNVVVSDYPLLIACVAGVDTSGIPVQEVAIDLTRAAGIVLPDNVFITVRSQSQDNGISAFAVGMFPQEGP